MSRTETDWVDILTHCGCSPGKAAQWAPVFAAEIQDDTFSAGDDELPDFLGQILHESGMLSRLAENLNYSKPERIMAVWPKRFANVQSAEPYVNAPEDLANFVYGGRMGNVEEGAGWRYRGRGLLQVTGRDNYLALGPKIGIDLIANPDLLAKPEIALRASIAWWEKAIPDSAMGDIKRITRAVNGGEAGLEGRIALTHKAAEALEA